MAVQVSVAIQNARLDVMESTTGTAPILTIRTGAKPANCAAANSGTVLATVTLPSDWMAAASGGSKAMSGTWQDLSADNTGTAAHFRIHDSGGTVCHMQGTVGQGSGDMSLDNTSLVAGQQFNVLTFTLADGNG